MAEFNLWSKESLVQFAQQSQQALTAKDEIIAELTAQVKAVHAAWRLALAQPVPSATLTESSPRNLNDLGTPELIAGA